MKVHLWFGGRIGEIAGDVPGDPDRVYVLATTRTKKSWPVRKPFAILRSQLKALPDPSKSEVP